MNKYLDFKNKYKTFIYDSYKIDDLEDKLVLTFNYEIEGLSKFNHVINIYKKDNINYDYKYLEKLVFNIGMIEAVSYWKLTCSPNIKVNCGYLDEYQINWFKKLFFIGLGEFFYVNDININQEDIFSLECSNRVYNEALNKELKDNLILVGGGKDSVVSLEILKNYNNGVLIINKRQICFDCAHLAGYTDDKIYNIERKIDPRLLELNNQGFLNGHVPISGAYAFISYLCAYLYGYKNIVLSNESSANEESVKGTDINHQYSKSYEFEKNFREYSNKYLGEINYFSLLRPLNELQIMKIFSKYPKYFNTFISCNNGGKINNIGKTDSWCLNCPKCLFIYIIFSNFISDDKLTQIFGENLLDRKDLLNYFIELTGNSDKKPFECVGTIEEVNYSI
ncbi:MAG TPA: hypothetical protein PKY25_02955, partial [Bacilli bacterium]|nr:hypothetical protein [Bacilli bacterium]